VAGAEIAQRRHYPLETEQGLAQQDERAEQHGLLAAQVGRRLAVDRLADIRCAAAQWPSSARTASTRRLSSSLSGNRSLWKIAWACRSIARGLVQLLGDRPLRAALSDEREDVTLAAGEFVQCRAATPGHEAVDDTRVERRSAGGHALDGVDKVGDVAHVILEQIADARRVLPDQLEHVCRLEVLGEHEDGHVGMQAPDLRGRDEPVVGVAGRHAYVHDRHVRSVGADLDQQVGGVTCAPDDPVARRFEQ
jgi:hypothetical protein